MLLFFGVMFLGLGEGLLLTISVNEGNASFNDAFYTFHLRLYGVRHKVKYHSDSERGNPLPPLHGLLFSICSKVSYIIHNHIDSIAHKTAFVNPIVERDKGQRGHHEGSTRRHIAPRADARSRQCCNRYGVHVET